MATRIHVDYHAVALMAADYGSDHHQGVLGDKVAYASLLLVVVAVAGLGLQLELEGVGAGDKQHNAADVSQQRSW